MKVWITKHALTQGIFEVEAEISENFKNICSHENGIYHTYYHKPYWYENKEDAIKHAKKLQEKMIKSLQKKIKIISEIEFK